MMQNHITVKSLRSLENTNFKIVSSVVKELACKDVGDGAMAEPLDIFYSSAREVLKSAYWKDRTVVLSGGGTVEKIDEVRYISNFSSGKMASSLALALYLKGAEVSLVSTRGYENLPKGLEVLAVQSSFEMYEALISSLKVAKQSAIKKPYLFMVAAVSDYLPSSEQKGKLKKDILGSAWNLELKQNIDILSSLDKQEIISIGFKAEMDKTQALVNDTENA